MEKNPFLETGPKIYSKDQIQKKLPYIPQTIREEPSLIYSFYINACFNAPLNFSQNIDNLPEISGSQTRQLPSLTFREALKDMTLLGNWNLLETAYGLIISFERKEDAEYVFDKMEIAKVLGGPVQVATLPNIQPGTGNRNDNRKNIAVSNSYMGRYNVNIGQQMSPHASPRNYVYQPPSPRLMQPPGPLIIRDVPWSITADELRTALYNQGMHLASIERWRQHIRIEVKNIYHYEQLIAEGFNFYNYGRFSVTAERPGSSGSSHNDSGNGGSQQDDVLQCYRCQGFWHVAANCRHLPRCVRCGEPHGVEYCTRVRSNPLCCNCSGAHHAAYKNCPVRRSMSQAAPLAFVLSRDRPNGSFAEVTANVSATEPKCML